MKPTGRGAQALLVLAVCALVYGLFLGTGGLTRSEGHRVGPGWSLVERAEDHGALDAEDLFVPRLFETAYVRKPPGAPWAIGVSSAVFGENAWAARLPSALASAGMALVAMAFAWRWFGRPFGLAAGLAQALTPWFWESGRAAEIEAAHNLGAMLVCLGLIDRLGARAGERNAWAFVAIALGAALALATKGPASAAAVGGALVGGALAARSAWALVRPRVWCGLALGLAAGGGVLWMEWRLGVRLREAGAIVVSQSPGEFLWGDWARTLAVGPTALAMALPAALAIVFPWGPDARAEAMADEAEARARRYALALALAWIAGAVVSTLAGLGNPRYLLPVATMTAPMVAYVVRGALAPSPGGFGATRRAIARAMLLAPRRAPPGLVWVALMLGAWAGYVVVVERGVRATSGWDAGRAIAEVLPEGARVFADHAIEARPEVLLSAERAGTRGVRATWRVWTLGAGVEGMAGQWALLRTDEGSDEVARVSTLLAREGLTLETPPAWSGRVHLFDLSLHRVVRAAE